jgi:hypothetical protein
LVLVIGTMGFFGSFAIIEALLGVEASAFDFATTFGLILMIGILAGTLIAGSRLVWAGAVALSVAMWSIALGVLAEDELSRSTKPIGTTAGSYRQMLGSATRPN